MGKIAQIISIPEAMEWSHEAKEHGFGLYETQGWRLEQEDAAFACWYTQDAFALLTPREIGRRLWTSYHELNDRGYQEMSGGSTASTTVYDGKGTLITATLADAVAFAAVYDKAGKVLGVTRLNHVIHHPTERLEEKRIKRAGGVIKYDRLEGVLAVSRALGDFEYHHKGLCADASIDVISIEQIFNALEIQKQSVAAVQIIITCDGFTEPVYGQSKTDHEAFLKNALKIPLSLLHLSEVDLAQRLAEYAIEHGSGDNVSVAVQTLDQIKPFMVGIYDGHGGNGTSRYAARNIGAIFDEQCSKQQEEYVQQPLSADKHFIIYCRDNKDEVWCEQLAAQEKKTRAEGF